MTNKKDKEEGLKKRAREGFETGAGRNSSIPDKGAPEKGDTDTAPDEFIAPNVDTDEPIDGEVRNDAVLRGEDHANDKALSPPTEKQQE